MAAKHPVIIVIGCLAIILFGIFLFDLLKNGQFLPQPHTQNKMALQTGQTSQPTPTEADMTVESYYTGYLSCLKKQKTTDTRRCPYNQGNMLTPSLLTTLQQSKDTNPLFCGQNFPPSVDVDKAVITNKTATVNIHPVWGESTTPAITVGLIKQDDLWKIASITCPT